MDAKSQSLCQFPAACFNPRARDGRENIGGTGYMHGIVSIHAPVMDAKAVIYWH